MSTNQLLFGLSVVSTLYFIYVSAKQIIRPDKILRINSVILPNWIWIVGILVSNVLTTLPILSYIGLLSLFPRKLIVSIYILILSLLTIYAFVVILMQSSRPLDNLGIREKFVRSVITGFAASFAFSSALSILWLLLDNSGTSNVSSLICLLIPAQIIVSIGTYSQLGWQKKFEENTKRFYEKQSSKKNGEID